ncbi:RICIN domain-containing protein [Demequina sp. NBRC 110053]|uniref:RICIN domain-containing protein n=1 Tax=Demequina sp. NBRC 110053 TaxID=1570342 RepID=UPI000A072939|nr:RICIN domain-containing protein [Demequina sp. NBRC 110053]
MTRAHHGRRRLALIAGLATFAVLAGTTAGWAYWTTQASVTAPASTANLTVTTANFGSLSATLANEALARTGSFTVTNNTTTSSTQRAAVTLDLSATNGNTYRGNFGYVVWRSTAGNPCTAAATPGPSLVPSGTTWANAASFTTVSGDGFAAGESRTYCVRTTATRTTENWPANGSVTFTPRVDARISLGTYTGAANATATQASQFLFPLHTPTTGASVWAFIHGWQGGSTAHCLDHFSGQSNVGGWPCKTTGVTNQSWQFTSTGGGYYTIRTNQSNGLLMQQTGTGITMNAASNAQNQRWTLQRTNTGASSVRAAYQIVNESTGQCITRPATDVHATMENCDGGADQSFLVVRNLFSGTGGAPSTVQCSVVSGNYRITTNAATPNMRYEARLNGAVVANTANGSGSLTIDIATSTGASASWTLELYEVGPGGDAGTRVAIGEASRTRSGIIFISHSYGCSLSGMG